jgi:hypothetical protein
MVRGINTLLSHSLFWLVVILKVYEASVTDHEAGEGQTTRSRAGRDAVGGIDDRPFNPIH